MRYQPNHKLEIRQKIVQDAGRRLRAEGLTGAAVSAVMRDSGLTHGGFYKHFNSKDRLMAVSLHEAFREMADRLAGAAEHAPPGTGWKRIVRTYLSPEHCDHPERGCPVAALAPELARADATTKSRVPREVLEYRRRMVPFMPGRSTAEKENNFIVIFSTMIGAVEIARLLPDAAAREKVLARARRFLLRSF